LHENESRERISRFEYFNGVFDLSPAYRADLKSLGALNASCVMTAW